MCFASLHHTVCLLGVQVPQQAMDVLQHNCLKYEECQQSG